MRGVFERGPGIDTTYSVTKESFKGPRGDVPATVDRGSIKDAGRRREVSTNGQDRIFECKTCSSHGELRESPHHLRLACRHERLRVEVADLPGHLAGVGRGVEGGDVVDGRLA